MFSNLLAKFIFPFRNPCVTFVYLICCTFLLLGTNVWPYDTGGGEGGHSIEGTPAHQHITKQSLKTWKGKPPEAEAEISSFMTNDITAEIDYVELVNYDSEYDDIITGSAEEDYVVSPLLIDENCLGDALNGFFEHFWNPDEPSIGGFNCGREGGGYNSGLIDVFTWSPSYNGYFDSAYRLAQYLWDWKAIPLYTEGNKAEAYYWLGRIAHLLEDMTVPGHVHLLYHDPFIGQGDLYEPYASESALTFYGEDAGDAYVFASFPWLNVHEQINPPDLFRLFWFTSQKTQYFASKSASGLLSAVGNSFYVKLAGTSELFNPSLWEGENVTIIGNPLDLQENLHAVANALVPHAMRAVGGLYRLFWLEFHTLIEGPDTVEIRVSEEFSGIGKINGFPATSWEWDFHYDGINFNTDATGQTVTCIFDQLGGKKIALRATASGQAPVIITKDIYVEQTLSAWHTFYGSSNLDYGYATATDGSGNVYVTGYSYATWNGPAGQSPLHAHSGGWDMFVLKLSSNGSYQWHTFYGSSTADSGYGIATDGNGDVYVTGESWTTWSGPAGQSPLHDHSGGVYDILVLKLDSGGSYQWHTFYGSGSSDSGYGIATDGNGNVYVTGDSYATWNGPAGQSPLHGDSYWGGLVVLKLSSNGSYQWHAFYASSTSNSHGIATDGSGNVYVTGESYGTWTGSQGQSPLHDHSGGYFDIHVLKLDSSGSYQWHTFYGSGSADYGYATATDGSGNVYVTGESDGTWSGPAGQSPLHDHSGNYDIFVLKLDSGGSYQWHTFYGASNPDLGKSIATDGNGNVYVTGHSTDTWNGPEEQGPLHTHSGGWDIFVLKLDSNGSFQWHTFYGSSNTNDGGISITTDASGNVYVTGDSYATWSGPAGQSPLHDHSGNHDIFVLKLSGASSSCDFDGDRKTDITVWRPGDGYWYTIGSKDGSIVSEQWGAGYAPYNDVPVPGDYDGDGKTDCAVWRPGDGYWYVLKSSGGVDTVQWGSGTLNDVPVPGDYDGDGKTDVAVWRPGDGYWYIISSKDGSVITHQWGAGALNDVPVPGDYDGDGKTDYAVWRPMDGYWYIVNSKDGSIKSQQWGSSALNDVLVPGDYDGDGKTDIAVWRPAEGYWYIISSKDGSIISRQWGAGYAPYNDMPVPGDYDGDGKTDFAVWRLMDGYWYILKSSDGGVIQTQWGWGLDPINDEPISQ